ncbi:tetratricopeptide repeat protein [Terriglobus tenax]|uniref:tetratricopeptide repeat protein n=1 Tax=Terriglobus tenax TaxID=1111115 RepID=UPI0021E0AA87|nr:tetratricopeptide repeat protein [Terriglobus tenax]
MATSKTPPANNIRRMPRTIAAQPAPDAARQQALEQFSTAVQLMQSGKFDKALAAFDKLLPTAPFELGDRIRTFRIACAKQTEKATAKFASEEERCDFAVVLLNDGNYADAREHFNEILKKNPQSDFALYGLSVLSAITGDFTACLEHLTVSISLNPHRRIQARSDSDFQDMADDPRFTELLYPEP